MKIKKLFVFLALIATGAYANATTIKIASLAPDGSGWMNSMKEASVSIKKKTDNRVNFRFYPGGIMGSDASVIRKIRVGQLHGGAIAAGALKNLATSVQIYAVPFTFNSDAEVMHLRAKYDAVMKKELKNKGFDLLGVSSGGFAYLMSANPIKNIEDIRKQKSWLPDDDFLAQEIFKIAGINPMLLPVSDVYTSLQTGLINTVAINPSSSIILQWYSKLNYAVDLPLTMLTGIFVIDSKVMKKLSPKDRQIVADEFGKIFKKIDAQNLKDEKAARKALEAGGMKFVSIDEQTVKDFKKYTKDALAKLQSSEYPKKLYKQLLQDLKEFRKTKAN